MSRVRGAATALPALAPDEAVALLEERVARLEQELAGAGALRELVERAGLPRLFWVEAELAAELRETELDFVRRLRSDIAGGHLEGLSWWRRRHEGPGAPSPMAAPSGSGSEEERP